MASAPSPSACFDWLMLSDNVSLELQRHDGACYIVFVGTTQSGSQTPFECLVWQCNSIEMDRTTTLGPAVTVAQQRT